MTTPVNHGSALSAGPSVGRLAGVRIVFCVNVDWFFLSHRLPVAKAAVREGATVAVVAGSTGRGEEIAAEGFEFVPIALDRSGRSVLAEARAVAQIARAYRQLRPDIVHHVTVKAVVYGSLARRLVARQAVTVNALSGLGFAFSSAGAGIRGPVERLCGWALSRPAAWAIFQNPEDLSRFVGAGYVPPERAKLIRGSGVDVDRFAARPVPEGAPVVLFASRMLLDKGVDTLVEAAPTIRAAQPRARIVLVGDVDPGNPRSLTRTELLDLARLPGVEWWGHRTDMPEVLGEAHVVVLPTRYPEGVPKILLEAAAVGRPMVATDVPGCREVVRPGSTGILVPPEDPEALAAAVTSLLADGALQRSYGERARRTVVEEFSEELVIQGTLDLYQEALGGQVADKC